MLLAETLGNSWDAEFKLVLLLNLALLSFKAWSLHTLFSEMSVIIAGLLSQGSDIKASQDLVACTEYTDV